MSRTAPFLLAVVAFVTLSPLAWASRIILAEIALLDGRVLILGHTADNGDADPDTVFRYLKTVTFGDGRNVIIRPDADNPLRATLEGKIKVSIDYGRTVEVAKLRLVQDKKTTWLWRIDPADVEEMLKPKPKK